MNEDIRLWVAPLVRISTCWDPIQTLHKRMAALVNATFMYIQNPPPPGCCHRPRVIGINDYLLIQMSDNLYNQIFLSVKVLCMKQSGVTVSDPPSYPH